MTNEQEQEQEYIREILSDIKNQYTDRRKFALDVLSNTLNLYNEVDKEIITDDLELALSELKSGWSTVTPKGFKEYTPETLLQQAEKHIEEKPGDLIQAAEKVWLAVAFSIKIIMLRLNILLPSHKSIKESFKFIASKHAEEISKEKKKSSVDLFIDLSEKFKNAEFFHKVHYGFPTMKRTQFDKKKKKVEDLINDLKEVDIKNLRKKIKEYEEEGKALFIPFELEIKVKFASGTYEAKKKWVDKICEDKEVFE